jgi:hypothetical protein
MIKPSRIGTTLSQGAALGEQQASPNALPSEQGPLTEAVAFTTAVQGAAGVFSPSLTVPRYRYIFRFSLSRKQYFSTSTFSLTSLHLVRR